MAPVQKFFLQPCDHFNAFAYDCTFHQQYFIDDAAWRGPENLDAMITFIPGNSFLTALSRSSQAWGFALAV